ncbi:UNVERIFIED_ORG: hypothetical protein J2Y78_004667 [Buttiauxella agrestis ATCC 33320]
MNPLRTLFTVAASARFCAVLMLLAGLWLAIRWAIALP